MRTLIFVSTVVMISPQAWPCLVPPVSYFRPLEVLIGESDYVALARLERREQVERPDFCRVEVREKERALASAQFDKDDGAALLAWRARFEKECSVFEYDVFEVIETLHGEPGPILRIPLSEQNSSSESTFREHEAWRPQPNDSNSDRRGIPDWGRVGMDTDCKLYPSFSIGAVYLLFGGAPHALSYERIDSPSSDGWLEAVRNAIRGSENG